MLRDQAGERTHMFVVIATLDTKVDQAAIMRRLADSLAFIEGVGYVDVTDGGEMIVSEGSLSEQA